MDIRSQLLIEHSRANSELIADYIGSDPERIEELLRLFFANENLVTQRSAYVFLIISDRNRALFLPHLKNLVSNLANNIHDAVKRNTLRLLQELPVPENLEGTLANVCFDYLQSNKEPVAIKVFAMTILANLATKYPDLKNELKIIIDDLMQNGSSGIRSRGKKLLLALDKTSTHSSSPYQENIKKYK